MSVFAERTLRPAVLAAVTVWTVLCFVISGPTKDKPGVEGAVSWVGFIGSWTGLIVLIVLGAAVLIRRLARR